MRKHIIVFFLSAVVCNAQIKNLSDNQYFKQGDFEISFSAGIGSNNMKNKSSFYSSESPEYIYEYSEEEPYIQLGVTAGFYIINNLSIEPELDIELTLDNSSYLLIGNLSYTFFNRSGIFTYIKAGYGRSTYQNFNSEDYNIINAGAGLKLRYTDTIALKFEVNYKHMSTAVSSSAVDPYGIQSVNKNEISMKIISLSAGFAILF